MKKVKEFNPEKKWCSSSATPRVQLNGGEYVDYTKDPELAKLIEGKRIAFVGPSPHLIESDNGSLIDSYDIVIRPGQLFEIPSNKVSDIGSRTDVLCHSFNIFERAEAMNNLEFLSKLKYIICSMFSGIDITEQNSLFNKLKPPVHNVDDRYLLKIWEEVGTTLNCGFASILVLLNYNIKELYVTGITFYNMGNFGKIYYDDYMDKVISSEVMRGAKKIIASPEDARADLHNQSQQIAYFRKLVYENPELITLDEYLTENLFKD